MSFFHLISLKRQGLRLRSVELFLDLSHSISLTIETLKKKNIDTFRVTNKQHYKAMLFYKLLSNQADIFTDLLPNTRNLFQRQLYQTILLSFSDVNLQFKSLLTGISTNGTFITPLDLKKLKMMFC